MKKFNEELYKEITKNGTYKDNYYKYIIIEKNMVFKSWDSNYLDGLKYEFFGIIDKNKKDIITLNNAETLQNELIEETKSEILKDILNNKEEFTTAQKQNFYNKLKNEEFKKRILYTYTLDNYTNNNFKRLYVTEKTPNELYDELLKDLITTKKVFNNDAFLKKYIKEPKESIKNELKEVFTSNDMIDKWNFEREWNNENDTIKIDCTFNNNVSLKLNKINFIINEYKKFVDNANEQIKKSKLLYNVCKKFKEENENKTCTIAFNNNLKLKCLDFSYLITCFENGNEKFMTYRLLTNAERNQLEQYNTKTKETNRDDDLYTNDIEKLEFGKKIIFAGGNYGR